MQERYAISSGEERYASSSDLLLEIETGHVDDNSTLSGSTTTESRFMRVDKAAKAKENLLMAMGDSERESLKGSRVLREMTINKLKYQKVGMIGREKEIQELELCVDRMIKTNSKELIFIKGESGVGKSRFAKSVEAKVKENGRKGAYALGKFDSSNGINEPCSAIVAAFGTLCVEAHMDPDQKVGGKLLEELGSDAYQLAKFIPQLSIIMPPDHDGKKVDQLLQDHQYEANQKRWEYAFRVLARVFCAEFSPLILVLDDLQWADEYSWTIMDLLLSDSENSSNPFMIIGSFRSDQKKNDNLLDKAVEKLAAKAAKQSFGMTQFELEGLNTQQTNQMVMALLDIDDEVTTAPLAELCHRRTFGNPHFIIEFVTTLEQEELISYNLGLLQWQWEVDDIEEKTMSTENVVDLLHSRMSKLPARYQLLLQYAACLGTSFRKDILLEVWLKHGKESESDLDFLCDELEKMNFLEIYGSKQYRWTHDKVKEAVLAMRGDRRSYFQFEVGNVLLMTFGVDNLGEMLFQVTDLINPGVTERPRRRLDYARLNLQAAEKALGIAAFASAATYATKGIECLPENTWGLNFPSTLRLYTIAIDMELALGQPRNVEAYSQEVLSQPKCSALDKTPIYMAKAYAQTNIDGNPREAVTTLLKALKRLHVPLFRIRLLLPFNAVVSLIKTIRLAKRTPKETYQSLPIMADKKMIAITQCLSKLNYTAYMAQDMFTQLLSVVRLVNMTLKHGISAFAGFAFGTLGFFTIVVMKDVDAAAYFAEMGLLMQKKSPDKFCEASTIYITQKFVFPWTRSHNACTLNMKNGYRLGARTGNIEFGLWCHASVQILNPFHDGHPLPQLKDRCKKFLLLAEDLKQEMHGVTVKVKCQAMLNLMGLDKETTELNGTVYQVNEHDMKTHNTIIIHHQLLLLVHFREYEKAAKLALSRGNAFEKEHPGLQDGMNEAFLRSIALYAMARKTKERKYKRQANKIRKTIRAWEERGNPNIKLYYWVLCAEDASVNNHFVLAHSFYDQAINTAARTGNLYMAALANGRYADCLQNEMNAEAYEYRIDETIRFYRRWGADALVEKLEKLRHMAVGNSWS